MDLIVFTCMDRECILGRLWSIWCRYCLYDGSMCLEADSQLCWWGVVALLFSACLCIDSRWHLLVLKQTEKRPEYEGSKSAFLIPFRFVPLPVLPPDLRNFLVVVNVVCDVIFTHSVRHIFRLNTATLTMIQYRFSYSTRVLADNYLSIDTHLRSVPSPIEFSAFAVKN